MIRLAITLARAGGWPRMLLLGSCTAVVSALLLVAVTIARLPLSPQEFLFDVVADPGTRFGFGFAVVLLTLPPLLLLHQAVRLGTAARSRRLAALRLAGATPGEVRRLGALDVGISAFLGCLVGIALYGLLRLTLGGDVAYTSGSDSDLVTESLRLVPTSVSPQWWEALLVVLGTTALGFFVGARASRAVVVTPLGVARRQSSPPPRPWGLALLVGAILLLPVAIVDEEGLGDVAILGAIALAILGVISLAPWAAYRAGVLAASRATSPAALLAARRLVADPRPAGRAAAAVGAISLVSGGAGALGADLVAEQIEDPFYYLSLALVAGALLVALLIAIGTLVVHAVESLLDRRRSVASLAALGMSIGELQRAQRWEAGLVALPMATAGVLLGSLSVGGALPHGNSLAGVLLMMVTVVVVLALVWLAITASVRITRPWAVRAASVANLRTE